MHLEIMEARDLDFVMSYLRFRKDLDDVFFVAGHMIIIIDGNGLLGLTAEGIFGKIIMGRQHHIDGVLFAWVPL